MQVLITIQLVFRASKLVKMDILINGDMVDALSSLIHDSNAITLVKNVRKNQEN